MLDTLSRELTTKALKLILNKMKKKISKTAEIERLLDTKDRFGLSLIHYLACVDYHEAITLLVDFGASVNLLSDSSETAIHLAAKMGHELSVKALIQAGASLLNT